MRPQFDIPLNSYVPNDIHVNAHQQTELFQSDENVTFHDQNIVYHDKINQLGIQVTEEISHITERDLNVVGFSFKETVITVKKNLGTILYSSNLDLIQYLSDVHQSVLSQKHDQELLLVQAAQNEKEETNPILH